MTSNRSPQAFHRRALYRLASRARQSGWGATEYIAVLLGLMAVWRGAQAVLTLVREHHDEFSWALMIPF